MNGGAARRGGWGDRDQNLLPVSFRALRTKPFCGDRCDDPTRRPAIPGTVGRGRECNAAASAYKPGASYASRRLSRMRQRAPYCLSQYLSAADEGLWGNRRRMITVTSDLGGVPVFVDRESIIDSRR